MTDWPAVIADAARDRDSGSWRVATRAARGLELAAAEGADVLRGAIEALLRSQPTMAALRNLANTVAWAAEGAAPAAAAQSYVERGEVALREIAEHTAVQLSEARRAVTVSASGAVVAALLQWGGPVLILESRPRNEGVGLARRLAAAGLEVSLAVDAAARAVLAAGDVVLLGADSVTPPGVSNKIGSWALAAAARERNLPVYILAGPEKLWPHPLPDPGEMERDAREVLSTPIPGVQVRNPYFELISFSLIAAIIMPEGPQRPRQIRAALERWNIHPWLQQLQLQLQQAQPGQSHRQPAEAAGVRA